MHTTHWLSCAMRMRAASRTRTGNVLLLYAASLRRFTALPISGRSDHTMTASPPSPSGTSMRAIGEHYLYFHLMELGVVLPQTEIGPDPADIIRFVEAAEAHGFEHVVVYDHVVGADRATRPDWPGPYDLYSSFHEPFVLYGFLAARTQMDLVTGVIILPQRQAVLVAKQAAEVDVLTRGNFRLGVGIGWNAV